MAGRWSAGRLAIEAYGCDRRLPGLAELAAMPGAQVLSHRAGRRATVRLGDVVAKVVPPDRVDAVVDGLVAAAAAVTVPDIVDVDRARGVVTVRALGGAALHDRLADADVRRVAAVVRRLHALEPGDGGVRGPREEARVLQRWLDRLRPFDPALYDRVASAADRVTQELSALEPSGRATIHGDLHDKQLFLLRDGGVAMIDLDTLGPGDPAIDFANLAVHIEMRALQGRLPPARAGELARELVRVCGPLDLLRRATWLRLACVYAFRPGHRALPALIVERATRAPSPVVAAAAGRATWAPGRA